MSTRHRGEAHDPLCWKTGWPQPEHDGDCFGSVQATRADEREKVYAELQYDYADEVVIKTIAAQERKRWIAWASRNACCEAGLQASPDPCPWHSAEASQRSGA